MKAKIFFLFVSLFLVLWQSLFAAEIKQEDTQYFKHEKYKENIGCIKPYIIEGADKVYIKQDGILLYIIELYGSVGSCSYTGERLVFKKNTPQSVIDKSLKEFSPTINMDLSFKLKFKVRRMNVRSHILVNQKQFTVPYFIVFNNRLTNEISEQIDYKIEIPLSHIKEKIYETEPIIINKTFNLDNFVNIELLSGIYFNKTNND